MVGSIGGSEIILIFLLALLLFGPRKLPEIGRTLGRTVGQLRRAATDFKTDLEREIRTEELRDTGAELGRARREISAATEPVRTPERDSQDEAQPGSSGAGTERP